MALAPIRHGKEDDIVGDRTTGHPSLQAVDDVLVGFGVIDRRAAHVRRIRARLGLGQRIGAKLLATGQGDQEGLLLLVAAKLQDTVADQGVVDRHDRPVGGAGLRDLDHGQDIAEGVHARAAVLLRDLDPHEAELAHLFHRLGWELRTLVDLGSNGRNLALGKIAGHIPDHLVLFIQNEVHSSSFAPLQGSCLHPKTPGLAPIILYPEPWCNWAVANWQCRVYAGVQRRGNCICQVRQATNSRCRGRWDRSGRRG